MAEVKASQVRPDFTATLMQPLSIS